MHTCDKYFGHVDLISLQDECRIVPSCITADLVLHSLDQVRDVRVTRHVVSTREGNLKFIHAPIVL